MCRYSFNSYKPHYVCFTCRKTFKQPILEEMIIQNGDWDKYRKAYINYNSIRSIQYRLDHPKLINRFEKEYRNKKYTCPNCSSEMNAIGKDFKAPKKENIKEWSIIKSMYILGNTFHTCGCNGPGFIPREIKQYKEYLESIKLEYQSKLQERNPRYSEIELNDFLEYWNSKLKELVQELNKIKKG